ncbi:dynein light chain Tctex-type protein 2B-like [Anopheles nili]|uniref:dynein light chain Tctex-type protein 2B-like n=1 Tax=Anopheles nili TaxID=185578 RepID=UPI00237A4075|nr:dynein light chain Tctex-type protein 2B-like [Anopheles nili]
MNQVEPMDVSPTPAAYQMRPELDETFKSEKIREIINTVLTETLTGQSYSAGDASRWTKLMADKISVQVKDLDMNRYKHVVQVWLGQQLGAGCKCVARCRWDTECDNYATAEFKNSTIFCVVTVYGLYLY